MCQRGKSVPEQLWPGAKISPEVVMRDIETLEGQQLGPATLEHLRSLAAHPAFPDEARPEMTALIRKKSL